MATNAPRSLRRIRRLIDNLYYIFALEAMHAAQAIDLRQQADSSLRFSRSTEDFVRGLRKTVPFLAEDRALTADIAAAYAFLKAYRDP